jgi:hypothetical protein
VKIELTDETDPIALIVVHLYPDALRVAIGKARAI